MATQKAKDLLKAMLAGAKDASTRAQIEELIKELETPGDETSKEDTDKIPKATKKKIVDVVFRFFIKLAEHKTIKWILEILEELDDPT